jgi:MHS family proline/betaine transporter-like MFS transporter
MSIGYSVSTAVFGGTAPIVVTKLIAVTGDNIVPAYYIMAAAVIAILPIVLIPETARLSISHATEVPGTKAKAAAATS